LRAENPGAFTLDGTRTFIVGRAHVAIIDPGPDDPRHLERVAAEVRDVEGGWILLTHGHPDHVAGTPTLARTTGLPVGAPFTGANWQLRDGDEVPVDGGALVAVGTPGHTRDHLAFHHRENHEATGGDLFAGDLLLGAGKTTWVGEYAGCVADYLASLDRIERLAPDRIFPAHGPALERPLRTLAEFRGHRLARIDQVKRAWASRGRAEPIESEEEIAPLAEGIVREVYGEGIAGRSLEGARWSVRAMMEYLGVAPFPRGGAPSEGGGRPAPEP